MKKRMERGADGKFAFPFDPYSIPASQFRKRIEDLGYDADLLRDDLFDSVLTNRYGTNFKRFSDHIAHNLKMHGYKDMWDMYFEDCHPFFYLKIDDDSRKTFFDDDGNMIPEEETLDLPYPCCHFEAKDQHLFTMITPEDKDEELEWFFITSIIAKEVAPKEYRFYVWATVRNRGHIIMTNRTIEVGRETRESWQAYNAIVVKLMKRLRTDAVGKETSGGRKIKIGTGKDKRFWKPKPIVHIAPKKLTSILKPFEGAAIDWSHQWEVRGHWRGVSGVGKNRDGEYNVSGFTWVVNHTKGPENQPLIKKSYIVEEA